MDELAKNDDAGTMDELAKVDVDTMDELVKDVAPEKDDAGTMDELAKDAALVVPDSEDEEEDLTPEDVALLPACGRCGGVHDVKDLDACRLARRKPCYRCGLVHSDYTHTSWIYGLDNFDCEILIPDVDEVNMDGATLVLPQQVLKKLDDIRKKKESDKGAEIDEAKMDV